MQLYKVKLRENNFAKPEQIVNGYLAAYPNELGIYTAKEALSKAMLFNGDIEPHGKMYTTKQCKILQLSKQELSPAVLKELNGREVYTDNDDELNEPIYYGDVFDAILGEITETIRSANTPEVIDELMILSKISAKFEYLILI